MTEEKALSLGAGKTGCGGSGLRRRRADGREGGLEFQTRRKIVDKSFHCRVPSALEAEEIHFFNGQVGGPFLEGHAIRCDKYTSAVAAEEAVDENLLLRIAADYREKLAHLLVGWCGPAVDGDVDEAHTKRFGAFAFPFHFFAVLGTEIDDSDNAQLFQFREALFIGLRSTVEYVSGFSRVMDTGDMKLLA